MDEATGVVRLADLGVLRIAGIDAARFLQGQLSNDTARLDRGKPLLAGYHNPQGRVIAILTLLQTPAKDILALLPRELAAPVAERLRKFVLRSKVTLTDDSAAWRIQGVIGDIDLGDALAFRISETPSRWVVVSPETSPDPLASSTEVDRSVWTALDIADGRPQIHAETSEAFVAQMLNLDLVDGIAFDKGCYTGQEVVARAHFRGRVKRRMQRFRTTGAASLKRGESAQLSDGRSAKIVEALTLSDGRSEFLAVAPLIGGETAEAIEGSVPAEGAPTLTVEYLPVPYELPTL